MVLGRHVRKEDVPRLCKEPMGKSDRSYNCVLVSFCQSSCSSLFNCSCWDLSFRLICPHLSGVEGVQRRTLTERYDTLELEVKHGNFTPHDKPVVELFDRFL